MELWIQGQQQVTKLLFPQTVVLFDIVLAEQIIQIHLLLLHGFSQTLNHTLYVVFVGFCIFLDRFLVS